MVAAGLPDLKYFRQENLPATPYTPYRFRGPPEGRGKRRGLFKPSTICDEVAVVLFGRDIFTTKILIHLLSPRRID